MRKIFNPKFLAGFFFLLASLTVFGETYVVVGRPSKVFDTPNAKGYVTLNTKNKEVIVSRGMVFKSHENNNGWHLIEYSPGLRGYLSNQGVSMPSSLPVAGSYKVDNKKGASIQISHDGNKWSASVDGTIFEGKQFDNLVIFFNQDNTPAYSIVQSENGPIVFCYDNNCTEFF